MVIAEHPSSSIRNCLKSARENARAVRGALTDQVWGRYDQPDLAQKSTSCSTA